MIIAGLLLLLGSNIFVYSYTISEESAEISINENNYYKPIVQSFGLGHGVPPFINNFIHQGTNLFLKPSFMMPSTNVIPSIEGEVGSVAHVEPNQVLIEATIPEMDEEVNIPDTPIFEGVIVNLPSAVPCSPKVPEAPILIEHVPEEVEISVIPNIPEAPVLPPLELPELPVLSQGPEVESTVPCVQGEISTNPEITEVFFPSQQPIEIVQKVVICQPPQLPLVPIPEHPIKVAIQEPCSEVSIIKVECNPQVLLDNLPYKETNKTIVAIPSPPSDELESTVIFDIPPAPVLPPFELPELPVLIEESKAKITEPSVQEVICTSPKITEVIIPSYLPIETIVNKVVIPQPPKLPLVPIPDHQFARQEPCPEVSTVEVEKLPTTLEFDTQLFSDHLPYIEEPTKTVILIPPPPEIPLITLPKLPLHVIVPEKVEKPETITIEPNICVHNIVIERVIPNIFFNNKGPVVLNKL